MEPAPKWYWPITVLALLWNLIGFAAVASDLRLSAEEIAQLSEAEQALHASRPVWAVAATLTAVCGGAVGCLGLILRKRWAMPLLLASLLGVIVQDVGLFLLTDAARHAGPVVYVLQGFVLAIAIGLVLLAWMARARRWIA